MSTRNYSNNAVETELSSATTDTATSLTVSSATGFPAAPFILAVDAGATTQELVLVTAISGTTLTVTRGYDNTVAQSHEVGAKVQHAHAALDFREANTHVNDSTAVHGLGAGSAVVGTTDTQVVTNKDLTSATNTFPADLVTEAELTASADTAQALTNKDLTSSTNTFPALGVKQVVVYTASGTFDKATYAPFRAIRVRMVGGGGGGGDSAATVSGESSMGGGGGSGAYAEGLITYAALESSVTVTVGAGGASGGGTGATTEFGASTATLFMTAPGGAGGNGHLSNSIAAFVIAGAGGDAGTGDVTSAGRAGEIAARISGTTAVSGKGADSMLGSGGRARTTQLAGSAGTHGGGGSGALSFGAGDPARAGGAGGNGLVIVEVIG